MVGEVSPVVTKPSRVFVCTVDGKVFWTGRGAASHGLKYGHSVVQNSAENAVRLGRKTFWWTEKTEPVSKKTFWKLETDKSLTGMVRFVSYRTKEAISADVYIVRPAGGRGPWPDTIEAKTFEPMDENMAVAKAWVERWMTFWYPRVAKFAFRYATKRTETLKAILGASEGWHLLTDLVDLHEQRTQDSYYIYDRMLQTCQRLAKRGVVEMSKDILRTSKGKAGRWTVRRGPNWEAWEGGVV